MRRPLEELRQVQDKLNIPILCGGDIFHHWQAPPQLINFALEHLPGMFAVPGNHDLPGHNYADIQRSAYWTLVKAGKITNLPPNEGIRFLGSHGQDLMLYGYPCGFSPQVNPVKYKNMTTIAVAHQYVWKEGHAFPGVPPEHHYQMRRGKFHGFRIAVFGDNHKGFSDETQSLTNGPTIVNCGSLIRRNSDQVDYKPTYTILYDDESLGTFLLQTANQDIIEKTALVEEAEKLDASGFVEMLQDLGVNDQDFPEAVRRYMKQKKVDKKIQRFINEVFEEDES